MTARNSPRCPGSGIVLNPKTAGHVVDCPECLRPMTARTEGLSIAYAVIPSHGSIRTRATDYHDALLRDRQRGARHG